MCAMKTCIGRKEVCPCLPQLSIFMFYLLDTRQICCYFLDVYVLTV